MRVRVSVAHLAVLLQLCDALNNGLALTPQLGWRSWNNFGIKVDDNLMYLIAKGLVDRSRTVNGVPTSLSDLGYVDLGVDDGWQAAGTGVDGGYHDANGNPLVNTSKFPSLSAYVTKLHGMGLRAGWYLNNCYNSDNCGDVKCFEGNVGLVVNAGFDSVKIDSCSAARDITLHAALINTTTKTGPMLIENCHNGPFYPQVSYRPYPRNEPWCPFNLYRVSTDVTSDYTVIFGVNLRTALPFLAAGLSFPGCWAYPDMLEVGVLPGLHKGEYWLPHNEAAAHFNAWAVTSSPLILSMDLTNSSAVSAVWDIIANPEAIAVNQAWAGSAGGVFQQANTSITWPVCGTWSNCSVPTWEVLHKPLPGNSAAFLVLNHDENGPISSPVTLTWTDVPGLECGLPFAGCKVRDIFTHADLGTFQEGFTVSAGSLPSRTSLFITATPQAA